MRKFEAVPVKPNELEASSENIKTRVNFGDKNLDKVAKAINQSELSAARVICKRPEDEYRVNGSLRQKFGEKDINITTKSSETPGQFYLALLGD